MEPGPPPASSTSGMRAGGFLSSLLGGRILGVKSVFLVERFGKMCFS